MLAGSREEDHYDPKRKYAGESGKRLPPNPVAYTLHGIDPSRETLRAIGRKRTERSTS